jgi:transcription initiation factor TFIIH subunit 1
MRAGGQRASLPLMRRFNEHSERLLNQSLGSSAKRLEFGIDPGNAGERNSLYDDILLEDLNEATSTDRIMLDLGDRTTALQGAQEVGRSEMMDTLDREKVVRETKESFEFWEPNLGEVSPFSLLLHIETDGFERSSMWIARRRTTLWTL